MTLIIPNGYAQIVLKFAASNTRRGGWLTTWGAGEALGPDPLAYTEYAERVIDRFESSLAPIMTNQVGLESVEVIGPTASVEVAAGIGGDQNMNDAPPNVALLITKATPVRGRRAQGRMFWYGFLADEQIQDNGFIDATRHGVLQTEVSEFFAGIVGTPTIPVVILQNEEGQSEPISPPPVVNEWRVDQLVSTQRRRLR